MNDIELHMQMCSPNKKVSLPGEFQVNDYACYILQVTGR